MDGAIDGRSHSGVHARPFVRIADAFGDDGDGSGDFMTGDAASGAAGNNQQQALLQEQALASMLVSDARSRVG